MSKEQLDAVRDQLLAEQDNDLRQTFLNAFLEDAEKGAGMIINYAAEKGLKLDESPKEVIEYIGSIDSEDIDIEMTPEMLAAVAGGTKSFTKEQLGMPQPLDPIYEQNLLSGQDPGLQQNGLL